MIPRFASKCALSPAAAIAAGRQAVAAKGAKATPADRAAKPARAKPRAAVPPQPLPKPSTYRLDQLGPRQCRFACSSDTAREHRFCGVPTEPGPGNPHGSWCLAHRAVVFTPARRPDTAKEARSA